VRCIIQTIEINNRFQNLNLIYKSLYLNPVICYKNIVYRNRYKFKKMLDISKVKTIKRKKFNKMENVKHKVLKIKGGSYGKYIRRNGASDY
jgi:hypothetical protein